MEIKDVTRLLLNAAHSPPREEGWTRHQENNREATT